MEAVPAKFYPGEEASADELRRLADEYRAAADALRQPDRRRARLSNAPFRLAAIHAMELYLNAYLRHCGYTAGEIRAMEHDLAQRADLADERGLKWKARTKAHFEALAQRREYLAARYDPSLSGTSPINRLAASLEEVARKVTRQLTTQAGRPMPASSQR